MYKKLTQNASKIKLVKTHSPTLATIRMVEDILKSLEFYTIKFSELRRKLPKQIQHNTLKEVLRYLDESGKIYISIDGITWIYNPSKKLSKAIDNGHELTSKDLRKSRAKTY